ncbi:hypothetical protein Micbo1qcDRAFT_72865 [Microdochium bolleyi]|uniref:Uncharacterized protein n=1 Tax=Microdochium bolleyi TaxID=196109 RepID=A0A136IIN6_9PEZI|nr:hypothetical protein Micbo1qcDRAFT_72865 [Microdochium bolleyi]
MGKDEDEIESLRRQVREAQQIADAASRDQEVQRQRADQALRGEQREWERADIERRRAESERQRALANSGAQTTSGDAQGMSQPNPARQLYLSTSPAVPVMSTSMWPSSPVSPSPRLEPSQTLWIS